MALTIEDKGLDELIKQFHGGSKVAKRETHDAMEKSVLTIQREASSYTQYNPPHRPGQTYTRTFTMARTMSVKVHTLAGGIRGYVRGGVWYAQLVRGEQQAWMHVGRWRTLMRIAEEKKAAIDGFFRKAQVNVIRYLGR